MNAAMLLQLCSAMCWVDSILRMPEFQPSAAPWLHLSVWGCFEDVVIAMLLQIAALMERCKRNEEDAAEKARTVEALRRKLALAGRPGSSGSGSIALGSTIGGPAASYTFGAGNSGMLVQHAASGSLAGSYYTSGGAAPGSPGVSALRRSWAAESAGFGGSPAGSPTRSLGSYGPFS